MSNIGRGPIAHAIGIREALIAAQMQEDCPLGDGEIGIIAQFLSTVAWRRKPAEAICVLDTVRGPDGRRVMRLAVINDDMPFLTGSILSLLNQRGLTVHRLLHPVITLSRTDEGELTDRSLSAHTSSRESFVYMELNRLDSKGRNELRTDIEKVLRDVRLAVADWPKMRDSLRTAADGLKPETAAFINWLLDRRMVVTGHCTFHFDEKWGTPLGIWREESFERPHEGLVKELERSFLAGDRTIQLLELANSSSVVRREPMDMLALPQFQGDRLVGISFWVGLWTTSALATPIEDIPLLRERIIALEERRGFVVGAHASRMLRVGLSSFPRDVLLALDDEGLEKIGLTMVSLADRPRPKICLISAPFRREIYAFIWIPRDSSTSDRRRMICEIVCEELPGQLLSERMEDRSQALHLMWLTFLLDEDRPIPSPVGLQTRIEQLLRGWHSDVEHNLVELGLGGMATRLAITWLPAFPPSYRDRTSPQTAAQDVVRLAALSASEPSKARIYSDWTGRLGLKTYGREDAVPLSKVIPILENFGFVVVGHVPTALTSADLHHIYDFDVSPLNAACEEIVRRAEAVEEALAATLSGRAENDPFNRLIIDAELDLRAVTLFRAWFRYLRQSGMTYGLATVCQALAAAPPITRALIALFDALHGPACRSAIPADVSRREIMEALVHVAAIDDDHIIRRFLGLIESILRTNAFVEGRENVLAFKLDSRAVPNLPSPLPWREIWVYSPRVEGIHLRSGPIARGGLRWSDRRDDFRTEVLSLMKAQVVKNAVIVPAGAKGGFFPKQLSSTSGYVAWRAEGEEAYRIFIRALLSVTDNIVNGQTFSPPGVTTLDQADPYLVVAADKGTATFSDIANQIAIDEGYWLDDAFASGGSNGYDHKALGITAQGAWVAVTRHFAELGIDVQQDIVRVAGCGDMSGDVFGNGMLLSNSLKLVAAFDHRHIFIDPDPDPMTSHEERSRLYAMPASSWADYDASLISAGGGVYSRSLKAIPLSTQAAGLLGLTAGEIDPTALISAILRASVDLLWFGGIGTYVKASHEAHDAAGDPGNDPLRIDADQLRCKVVGEGANLSVTQAARIEFALRGGAINADFIDNAAGVNCSDNEVNIKIALSAAIRSGKLSRDARDILLSAMTGEVVDLVLADNRSQTLALSVGQREGQAVLPGQLAVLDLLETHGRIDRAVDGFASDEEFIRRASDGLGLTRPELAVLSSHAKIHLQAEIEASPLAHDELAEVILRQAFPANLANTVPQAIQTHRLRREIIATKVANILINRLGFVAVYELAAQEGRSLSRIAGAFLAADALFGFESLWHRIEVAPLGEDARLELLSNLSASMRRLVAGVVRVAHPAALPAQMASSLRENVLALQSEVACLCNASPASVIESSQADCAPVGNYCQLTSEIARLDLAAGYFAAAALAGRKNWSVSNTLRAYARLGESLGLEWCSRMNLEVTTGDSWERSLTVSVARDFEQIRIEFLWGLAQTDPNYEVEQWVHTNRSSIERFLSIVNKARATPVVTLPMLCEIAAQARVLLSRGIERVAA